MATATSRSRILIVRVLCTVGLVCMLIGAVDPLEGSIVILPATGLVTLAAFLGKSVFRKLMYWSLPLVVLGVVALWISSASAGFGGDTGRSIWWSLIVLPYAVGGTMGLVGAVGASIEAWGERR